MEKLIALFNAFRKGSVVADPTAWKAGQITVNVLAAFIVSIIGVAKAFGFELPITEQDATVIASSVLGIVGVFNSIATVVSSTKVGLPPKHESGEGKDSSRPANPLTGY